MAAGFFCDACMNREISAAECWPSASNTSAWVKPSRLASCNACNTAAPLPELRAKDKIRSPFSGPHIFARAAALPSVLPSITTHTGCQQARAWFTVSASLLPVL
jgi:hypothetical protein